jgi:hypothetical protein
VIAIPPRLAELLAQDASLHGAVLSSLSLFEPWLASSTMPFFPEYTDHGPKHSEDVLQTIESLIADQAWPAMSPGDSAVVILATLLHDSAMHLREDGFIALVSGTQPHRPILGFDDRRWDVLWQDFLAEASRFSGQKLHALFGDSTPVCRPPLDPDALTLKDRKLIGEFLRRHHARLAHEIARFGVPGPTSTRLELPQLPGDLQDLAGLVARSHGLPLRDCLPYLNDNFHIRDYHKHIHAVFLMALLRVADYLQIQADRAAPQLRLTFRLRSPVSEREWDVHGSIRNITFAEDDPERIYIKAKPADVCTYLRLKDWLAGIQAELDQSWAVLGEVYGRFADQGLDNLGLTLRRVASNLDDEAAFARKVSYVPTRIAFETASGNLLKLLVRPLYGDEPCIGIRELAQNALDAVRELQALQEQRPELRTIDLPDQEADVVIAVETDANGDSWATVSDRGIGMTVEVLRDYFLKAGASYRTSDEWRKVFEDEHGTSRVLRAGRFGIGALAAFLLGDRLRVETRHVDVPANRGIAFDASLDDEVIQMTYITRPVGTTIRIKLSPTAMAALKDHPDAWDWYVLPAPTLVRTLNGKQLPQRIVIPQLDAGHREGWHRLTVDSSLRIFWKYSGLERQDSRFPFGNPGLVCNGICIASSGRAGGGRSLGHAFAVDGTLEIKVPDLAVFDPDGVYPINLQRTAVTSQSLPHHDAVLEAVSLDLLAHMLHLPAFEDMAQAIEELTISHPALPRSKLHPYVITKGGILLNAPAIVEALPIESVLVLSRDRDLDGVPVLSDSLVLRLVRAYFATNPHIVPDAWLGALSYDWPSDESIDSRDEWMYNLVQDWETLFPTTGLRVLSEVPKDRSLRLGSYAWSPPPVEHVSEEPIQCGASTYLLREYGHCPANHFDFASFAAHLSQRVAQSPSVDTGDRRRVKRAANIVLAELYLEKRPWKPHDSVLAKTWLSVVGRRAIPFDPKARECILRESYDKLAPYLESWR